MSVENSDNKAKCVPRKPGRGGLDRSKVPVLMSVFGDVSSVPGASPRQLNKLPTGARLILG